ncbi:hypothetical protein PENTCL1PPCAC_3318, partial [Pristionchus entomophagus]
SSRTFSSLSINRSAMDIFSLPADCHREIMRRLTLKDRLRLRLVCRAFEALVAETNAGWFETGSIKRWTTKIRRGRRGSVDGESRLIVRMDDLEVNIAEDGEYRLNRLLQLRTRLFAGISFDYFEIRVNSMDTLDFVIKFITNFKIKNLHFGVDSDIELEISLLIMALFPRCSFTITIDSHADSNKLNSLPPMETIKLFYGCAQISTELFFKLLSTHKHMLLTCEPVSFTSQEWTRAMQIISDDPRTREVRLIAHRLTIQSWLLNFRITQATKARQACDDVNVTHALNDEKEMRLRYKNCWVRISDFDWSNDFCHSTVAMSNSME